MACLVLPSRAPSYPLIRWLKPTIDKSALFLFNKINKAINLQKLSSVQIVCALVKDKSSELQLESFPDRDELNNVMF